MDENRLSRDKRSTARRRNASDARPSADGTHHARRVEATRRADGNGDDRHPNETQPRTTERTETRIRTDGGTVETTNRSEPTRRQRETQDSERGPPPVVVEGLRKEYGDVTAVDDVSFGIESGEVVGILGPNGAGKTTCIKCTLGLIEPTAGDVRIAGVDTSQSPRRAYDRVGAMLEGARNVYWRLTVRENLEFFAGIAGRAPDDVRDRHDELLERLSLAEKADDPVKSLSRGMKQKVSLATTLARDVDVAFLDEPTLGLDVESSIELRSELSSLAAEEDTAIVVSSHDMDVIQDLCDRVIVLADGEIIADDAVSELLSVFRTQTYRVVFTDPSDGELRSAIETDYEVSEWTRDGTQTIAVVSLADGNELPELTGRIVEAGGDLDRVDTVEPDLEDVFLELTRGETDE